MRRVQLHRSFPPWAADRSGGPDRLPAVVLCPGLIQNRFTFEAPTRSFPACLRRRGWCVYVLEPHGRAPGPIGPRLDGIRDVVDHDVAPTVAELCARHPRVGFVGHSLGGILGLALPDEVRRRLAAMVTVGTPLLPAIRLAGTTTLTPWAARLARRLARTGVAIPGRAFGSAFWALRPAMDFKYARYPLMIYTPGSLHPVDLGHFLRSSWASDSFGVLADLLELAVAGGDRGGDLHLGRHLDDLGVPVLVAGGTLDGLAPPAAVEPLFERVRAPEKAFRLFGPPLDHAHFGHVDLLLGQRAPEVVWPELGKFLARYLSAPPG